MNSLLTWDLLRECYLYNGNEIKLPPLDLNLVCEDFVGKVCILLDTSSSMRSWKAQATMDKGHIMTLNSTCAEKAAFITAVLAKAVDAEIILYNTIASPVVYNKEENLEELTKSISCLFTTKKGVLNISNINKAFELFDIEDYDKIVVLTDNDEVYKENEKIQYVNLRGNFNLIT